MKGISCLDSAIAVSPASRDSCIRLALNYFVKKRQISGVAAEKVEEQYKIICGHPGSVVEKSREECQELCSFLKKLLILSPANADPKRGFSVNRECLVENQLEQSLVAQGQIYDVINVTGGVQNVPITKSLNHAARNVHAHY